MLLKAALHRSSVLAESLHRNVVRSYHQLLPTTVVSRFRFARVEMTDYDSGRSLPSDAKMPLSKSFCVFLY